MCTCLCKAPRGSVAVCMAAYEEMYMRCKEDYMGLLWAFTEVRI